MALHSTVIKQQEMVLLFGTSMPASEWGAAINQILVPAVVDVQIGQKMELQFLNHLKNAEPRIQFGNKMSRIQFFG